jgi:hypothetical protein
MVDDLGDYDVQPVDGNPFGAMADSPQNYDVQPVGHDPFEALRESNPNRGLGSLQPAPFNEDDEDYQEAMFGRPSVHGTGPVDAMSPADMYAHQRRPWEFRPSYEEGEAQGPRLFSEGEGRPPAPPPGVAYPGDATRNLWNPHEPWARNAAHDFYARDAANIKAIGPPHGGGPISKQWFFHPELQTDLRRGGRVGFDDGGGVIDLGQADDDTASQLAPAPSPLPAPVPDAPPPMTSADVLARGGIGTIGPGSFAPSDQARQLVQMGLEGAGMSRGTAQDISGNFSTEAGALPGTGQLLSGADALYHAGRGEYGQAALSGAGAVPDVGPLAHATGAMFLGPVARFADREGLGAAKTALQAGEHPYDVWSQHLWEHGPGDSWRTEIADPTQTGQWGQHGETKEIGDIYPHPELYQNYPGLESTPVDFIGGEHLPPGAMGAYDENNDRFLMNADLPPGERAHTLTHELQHKVQGIEGWPGGADPEKMDVHKPGTPGNFALNFILNQTTAAQRKAMGRDAIVNEAKRFAYETKTGEAQAENPFARLGMSMSERRAAYPATTEQIPRGNQWWTDPRTGKLSFGQDVEPRASGGPVQLNADLRRRLALTPRHGYAGGGVTDLGSDDLAVGASSDYVGPEGESGGTGQGSAPLYTVGRPGGGGGATGVLGSPGEAPSALSAFDPIAAEQARATEAAGRYSPVTGLPQKPIQLKDGSFYVPGPIATAQQAAEDYMRSAGLPYNPPTDYAKLDKDRAGRIAQAFDEMPHAPNDPAVRSSYEALARETMAQYQHVKGTGLKIDYITPEMADPYADNPREAIKDIRDNNHWWVYPTESGYGAEGASAADENPMLRPSGETISGRPTVINDIFRVVHDYFGHAKEGHGFRAEGEDNAWRSHMAMYSPEAVPAATTELRGQNSWLNYGPYGESNRTAKAADTVFADQKLGLMPDWTWKDGGPGAGGAMRPLMAPQLVGRPATSLVGEEERLMRQREGLEPPGGRPVEWTGGRISFARGGRVSFAGGGPVQLNADLRRRLALVTQPRHGFADGGASDEDPLGSSVTMAPDQTVDAPIPYTPEDIDQPGPMTETLAHYAGNPANAMPMRIGAAIGEEAKRMGQGLWSAATVPGDVASGKASMADPETQQRVTSLAASLPGGGPESALGARGPVGAAAKAVKGAPATRELNVWNPATGQWEGPKPTPNPPAGTTYDPLFNFDPALMNKVPDVPQFELQRYDPPRGVSDRMRDLVTNSDVRKQMIDIVKNGMQTVGLSWYNTGQLRAMFLKELGDDAGQQAFEKYMNLVSATSPENKIPQNIRTASYFYERDAAGVPPPERGDPIAEPYGSKAQKLHQQNVGNVLTEGYDVLKNPKPPSFVQNLMGNYAPGTMDRHAFKLPAILSKDPRFLETSFTPEKGAEPVRPQQMFQNGDLTMEDAVNQPTMWAGMPNKNEYAALEGWYKSIGDELGITPAQVQASAWVGGGHITGLASAADETFLHSFQGRVFNTAHHTGQTPSEVVKKMIRGEQPLLSGGPGMVPTAAQTSTAGAGGSPPPPSDQAEPGHPFY